MDPYSTDPRLPVAATCPRCEHPAWAGTGGWSTCTACGHSWPVGPVEVPAEPLDRLDGTALLVDRLDQLADRW